MMYVETVIGKRQSSDPIGILKERGSLVWVDGIEDTVAQKEGKFM